MTTSEIINLDFRKKENQEIIQRVLRKIKPLAKCSEEEIVPLEMLEKVVHNICLKYKVHVDEISPNIHANDEETIWCVTLKNEIDFEEVSIVFGISIYELFAKMVIKLYSWIRGDRLKLR